MSSLRIDEATDIDRIVLNQLEVVWIGCNVGKIGVKDNLILRTMAESDAVIHTLQILIEVISN